MQKISKPFSQNVLDIWRDEKDSTGKIIAVDENNSIFLLCRSNGFKFLKMYSKNIDEYVDGFEIESDAINGALDKNWKIYWFEGRNEFVSWLEGQSLA